MKKIDRIIELFLIYTGQVLVWKCEGCGRLKRAEYITHFYDKNSEETIKECTSCWTFSPGGHK